MTRGRHSRAAVLIVAVAVTLAGCAAHPTSDGSTAVPAAVSASSHASPSTQLPSPSPAQPSAQAAELDAVTGLLDQAGAAADAAGKDGAQGDAATSSPDSP